MKIIHRNARDDLDALYIANRMEKAGVEVFAINISERQFDSHVWGKTNDDSKEFLDKMDKIIEKECE